MSNLITHDANEEIIEDEKTRRILDKGYVRLVDHMGSDLSIVNAARASYAKESVEFGPNDQRLLEFLLKNNHWSPFRHAMLTFEVKAPLLVARQWWKYAVGSDHTMDAWNEASRRYITLETEFYIPKDNEWRGKPANNKQGSDGHMDPEQGKILTQGLIEFAEHSKDLYEYALDIGVAAEQARLFLAAYGMYTTWRWTASVQSVCHFITQRLGEGAQSEIAECAKVVRDLAEPFYPATFKLLIAHG